MKATYEKTEHTPSNTIRFLKESIFAIIYNLVECQTSSILKYTIISAITFLQLMYYPFNPRVKYFVQIL